MTPGERRPLGRFTGNRNLSLDPFDLGGLVALFNRAKVEEGVFLFHLVLEPGGPTLLAPKSHLNAVIRAHRGRRLNSSTTENDVQNPVHNSAP